MDHVGYATLTKDSIEKACEDRKYFEDLLNSTEDIALRCTSKETITPNLTLLCLGLVHRCRQARADHIVCVRKTKELNCFSRKGFPHFIVVREHISKVTLVWSEFFGIPCIHSSNESDEALLSRLFFLSDGVLLHALALHSVPEQETRTLQRILAIFHNTNKCVLESDRRSLRRDIATLYANPKNTVDVSNEGVEDPNTKLLIMSKRSVAKKRLKGLAKKFRDTCIPCVLAENTWHVDFLSMSPTLVAAITFIASEDLPLYESIRKRLLFLLANTDDDWLIIDEKSEGNEIEAQEMESNKKPSSNERELSSADPADSEKCKSDIASSSLVHRSIEKALDSSEIQKLPRGKRKSCVLEVETSDNLALCTKGRDDEFWNEGAVSSKPMDKTINVKTANAHDSMFSDADQDLSKIPACHVNHEGESSSALRSTGGNQGNTEPRGILRFADVDQITITSEEISILEFCVQSLQQRCTQLQVGLEESKRKREALVQHASDARSRIEVLQNDRVQQAGLVDELSKNLQHSRTKLVNMMKHGVMTSGSDEPVF